MWTPKCWNFNCFHHNVYDTNERRREKTIDNFQVKILERLSTCMPECFSYRICFNLTYTSFDRKNEKNAEKKTQNRRKYEVIPTYGQNNTVRCVRTRLIARGHSPMIILRSHHTFICVCVYFYIYTSNWARIIYLIKWWK